jgi:hypothetical protein
MGYYRRYSVVFLWVALIGAAAFAGGPQTKSVVFEKRQGIAAAPSKIFSHIADFKEYPRLFPESHNQVTVVSDEKDGKGVVFDNVAVYKSRTVQNRWTVTEFVRDRVIRMDSDTGGTVIILLHQIDYDTTEETVIASVNIQPKYKDELFAAFEKEMSALKTACEQHAAPADSTKR